ncbi:MAG TPA: BON domain-containing protein [Vicinamibacterales bacterium]|nr:BON domain-containing protein [Vicinamibacterales bacterium]
MLRRTLTTWLGAAALAATTIACAQSDPGITTAVKSKLAADDTVKAYTIDVDTKDRVVTLNGRVDTEIARDRALELARNTDGVRDVVDQMTVSPGATPTTGIDDPLQGEAREAARDTDMTTEDAQRKAGDAADRTGDAAANAALTGKVKSKLLADTDTSGLSIDVDSRNGVVTLTGTVRTAAEKNKAIALAKNTDGVKSVIDKLKIAQ